jgi:hypothetical protein
MLQLDNNLNEYLDQRMDLLMHHRGGSSAARFLDHVAGERFEALRRGTEAEFMGAVAELSARFEEVWTRRISPGVLVFTRRSKGEEHEAALLKLDLGDAVRIKEGSHALRAISGVAVGGAGLGAMVPDPRPDPRPDSDIIVRSPSHLLPGYFLGALEVVLQNEQFEAPGLVGPDGETLDVNGPTGKIVVAGAGGINDDLIAHIRRHPELMREISPRRLEELVAELLHRRGYSVELTPQSRDWGQGHFAPVLL